MIVTSKKSINSNKLMFILSSRNFWQAYKRISYMKQYASYRKKQGTQIKEKTITLQQYNAELVKKRKEKRTTNNNK